MAYILEHQYTDANLRLNHLKGEDRLMASALMEASNDGKACVFLANLQRTVQRPCEDDGHDDHYDHYSRRNRGGWGYDDSDENDKDEDEDPDAYRHHNIECVNEDTLELRLVVRPDGSKYATGVSIEEENIIQEDVFDDLPDEEDYEGYTGNAGPDVTHYYRKSAFLVMPKRLEVVFLFEVAKQGGADV